MNRGWAKVKCVVRVAIVLAMMSELSLCALVYGQESSAQYTVGSWGHKDGMSSTFVFSIAQTPDGFLCLGTEDGLVRFDGLQFTQGRIEMPNEKLPGQVRVLLVSREGKLLLGTESGLVGRVQNGEMQATQLDSAVISMGEAADGSVWAATRMMLWHLGAATMEPAEQPIKLPGEWVSGPLESEDGREWISTQTGLYSAQAGRMAQAAPGHAWLFLAQGHPMWLDPQGQLHSLGNGPAVGGSHALAAYAAVIRNVMMDSSGTLWVGTDGNGLLRVSIMARRQSMRQFSRTEGLSSNFIRSVYEDREHNLWVATENGLNRLRINRVSTLGREDGLVSDSVTSIAVGTDGSVWLATAGGLQRLFHERTAVYRRGVRILSLFVDRTQRLWAGTSAGLLSWRDGRELPAGKNAKFTSVSALSEDNSGRLWFLDAQKGLFQEAEGHDPVAVTNASFVSNTITAITSGPSGAQWFGFADGKIAQEQGGQFHNYSEHDGLPGGAIHGMTFGRDHELWVATERGVCFQTGARFECRDSRSGLPGNRVLWVLPDTHGDLWLGYNIGVARMNAHQLRAWTEKETAKPEVTFFDESDGIANSPDRNGNAPAALGKDGRLWLTTSQGVAVLDPQHLHINLLPPPVHILSLKADGKEMDLTRPVRLNPLTRSIQFSFTGLSLGTPHKMRFDYRLESFDSAWQTAGASREASYTNLPPGHYIFRVRASNPDGVWNDTGASLSLFLAPAYFQTLWFKLLCVVLLLLAAAFLFRLRLRSAQRMLRVRFEERMEDRTRIAQELHDHLIQEMVGIGMQLEVADELTPGSADAKTPLHRALTLSRSAIANGRLTLESLRQPRVTAAALIDSLRQTGDAYPEKNRIPVEFHVDGRERLLRPDIAEDLCELGAEALRNALKHARKGMIHVGLRYGTPKLELVVIDEGDGISEQVLQTGIPGHYGLAGMRERAARMGADLSITSGRGRGTTVHVSVAAARAYQDEGSSDGRSSRRRKQTVENGQ
jgi:signal transduction histidine kinase/ligand-binding sensor domain-containing protein